MLDNKRKIGAKIKYLFKYKFRYPKIPHRATEQKPRIIGMQHLDLYLYNQSQIAAIFICSANLILRDAVENPRIMNCCSPLLLKRRPLCSSGNPICVSVVVYLKRPHLFLVSDPTLRHPQVEAGTLLTPVEGRWWYYRNRS
jgi:hypothetical protein